VDGIPGLVHPAFPHEGDLMPASKKDDAPEPESDEKPAAKRSKRPERWELSDELERLKAEGNKNPERVAELKKLLAEGSP
jgi:hypothetical protein